MLIIWSANGVPMNDHWTINGLIFLGHLGLYVYRKVCAIPFFFFKAGDKVEICLAILILYNPEICLAILIFYNPRWWQDIVETNMYDNTAVLSLKRMCHDIYLMFLNLFHAQTLCCLFGQNDKGWVTFTSAWDKRINRVNFSFSSPLLRKHTNDSTQNKLTFVLSGMQFQFNDSTTQEAKEL